MSIKQAEKYLRAAELVFGGWTQGCTARDKNGIPVAVDDCKAVSFCAHGAATRAGLLGFEHRDAMREVSGFPLIASWNDAEVRTQSEVVDLLLAAATLEALS